eukprot:5681002-Amphidinium_carterae.1
MFESQENRPVTALATMKLTNVRQVSIDQSFHAKGNWWSKEGGSHGTGIHVHSSSSSVNITIGKQCATPSDL